MAEIKVPKPPKKAFNPKRPASDLLKHQINHLEWAIRHAGERRAGYKVKPIKTEADASARMAALMPKLSSAAQLQLGTTEIPDDQVPAKPARRTKAALKPRSKSRKKAKAKR